MSTARLDLLDVHGRQIQEGDMLRTPHFRGQRRKMFYLYHVVVLRDGQLWMVPPNHLAGKSYVSGGGTQLLKYRSTDAEIIDGSTNGWWYERARAATASEETNDRPTLLGV